MKALCLYFHMKLILEHEICKFGRHLPLATFGSERVKVSGKVPTYPSSKLTFTPASHLGQIDGLGDG